MQRKILNHYLEFSTYTFPGGYIQNLINDLPDDIKEVGLLIRKNIIHRTTLADGNTGTNEDLKYGDMNKVPWWRQPEDDILPTASAMLAEIFRRDKRGFVFNKSEENKLVVTCRYVSILIASILKAKGIPCRVRAGFADYFDNRAWDHWINEYWNFKENRWVIIDVDGSLNIDNFNPYDIPRSKFDWSAEAWLDVRNNKKSGELFWNAMPWSGLVVIAWQLFYDFHCLMNSEIIYMHHPINITLNNFYKLSENKLREVDNLASLMLEPDKNFLALKDIWENNKEFRLLKGSLL